MQHINFFKTKRSICGGLDVHKTMVQAAVQITDTKTLKVTQHTRQFCTMNNGLRKMAEWLLSYGCTDVALESTGKYWIPVCNVLEDFGINFKLVHPKYVKAVANHKTDKKDALFIASMYACDLCGPGSVILSKNERGIRDLARRYWKLGNDLAAEKNRLQNSMTMSNLSLDQVFSDVNGESAQKVLDEILKNESVTDEKLMSLLHKNCKNKDKLLDAVHDAKLTPDQKAKMADIKKHIDELEIHRSSILYEIMVRLQPAMGMVELLTTIPGIALVSAVLIIAEIGQDMSRWAGDRQFTSWAGLTPGNNESNKKKKSTRITKAGLYLKPLLVQCALAAVRDPNGYFGIKYRRIKKRRGGKKAIIAIARMMMVCVYHILKDGKPFQPTDYESLTNPRPQVKKEMTVEEAIKFLVGKNMVVSYSDSEITLKGSQPPEASPAP